MDIARPRSKLPKRLVASLAGALALVGLAVTAFRASAEHAPAVERSSVWIERVRRGDLVRQVATQGTLVPENIRWLSAGSAARVARITVRPGEAVDVDTVVVVLENPELELAALEAERQAASAEGGLVQLDVRTLAEQKQEEGTLVALRSDLRDAERQAHAVDRLFPEGLVGALDHRGAHDKREGLVARVATEDGRRKVLETGRVRQLAAQRSELERLREIARFRRSQLAALEVRAGLRGVVQDVPLENGQWVAVGAPLAKVAEPDKLKAEVRVSEGDAKDIARGQRVRFETGAGTFGGRVERVDPAVARGSVRLDVALDDALPLGARADQTVSGYVEIEKLEKVLFVARPAAARENAMVGLFRLEEGGSRAARVPVKLGRGSAREIEVAGGLAEGDEVIVSDVSSWDAAARIRLK